MNHKTLNIKGELLSLETPLVMGIVNITPDSFYAASRKQNEQAIHERIEQILSEGGNMIDIGGYSSRPDAVEVTPAEEMERLAVALEIFRLHYPDVIVSVDTFRADIARICVEKYGVAIINDISGGGLDSAMYQTVADLQVPYIMMHMQGSPQTMQQYTSYTDLVEEVLIYFASRIAEMRLLGVNDIIIDPGFGFSKTLDQNYQLMNHLEEFKNFDLPLLVGISRKSMIYNFLGETPLESLNGTSVLNSFALLHGADILRVHDVKEAVEAVKLIKKITTAG